LLLYGGINFFVTNLTTNFANNLDDQHNSNMWLIMLSEKWIMNITSVATYQLFIVNVTDEAGMLHELGVSECQIRVGVSFCQIIIDWCWRVSICVVIGVCVCLCAS
jgi:hypothetical protein